MFRRGLAARLRVWALCTHGSDEALLACVVVGRASHSFFAFLD